MKKVYSIIALVLMLTLVISSATVAFAAESGAPAETLSTQGSVIYYPASGSSSGSFSGIVSSNNAVYRGIPAGTYYFDYSYDSQMYAGTLVITNNSILSSESYSLDLVGDGAARSTTSINLNGGSYTVKINASPQSSGTTKYYAYNLILK